MMLTLKLLSAWGDVSLIAGVLWATLGLRVYARGR